MGFLSLDGTFWVQIVNLIVFILVLNVVFLKPVGQVIAQRRAYLDQLAADVERAEADVRALRGQAEDKRAAARRAVDEALIGSRATAQDEANRISGEFGGKASAIVERARAEVAAEEASARAEESRIVDDLAREMLERAVGPSGARA